MNAKFTLAIIALVGIGVFALPSTMSLFTGQHAFYNIDAEGNQVPCAKCHGDIQSELKSTHSEVTGTNGPHAAMTCEMCHRAEKGAAFGDNVYVRSAYANASFVLITTMANYQVGNYPGYWNLTQQTATCSKTGGVGTDYSGIDCWALQSGNPGLLAKAGKGDYGTPYDGQMALNTSYTDSGFPEKAGRIIFETLYEEGVGPKDTDPITSTMNFRPKNVTVKPNGFQNEPTGLDADGLSGTAADGDGAGSRIVTPGTRYHAASLVSCMECHGGSPFMHHYTDDAANSCVKCHYSNEAHTPSFENMFAAGGFGLTAFVNDTGVVEAHNAWVKTNDTISRFGSNSKGNVKNYDGVAIANGAKANNDACIACHTHVAVDINFTKGYKLAFDAKQSALGVYTTGVGRVEGSVTISVYGNQSGETFAVGDQSITWTPETTLYVVDPVTGEKTATPIVGLNGESVDNKDALIT